MHIFIIEDYVKIQAKTITNNKYPRLSEQKMTYINTAVIIDDKFH